jgi:endoglucanase Acf2
MFRTLFVVVSFALVCASWATAQNVKIGEATYFLAPKGNERRPPEAPHRTLDLLNTAAQTNQWYSTLIFDAKPQAIFAQPLSVKAATEGFEIALPRKEVVPTFRKDVEIHYPHKNPLKVKPLAFALPPAKLSQAGDWSIGISMAAGPDAFESTVAHGSPFVYFKVSRGDIQITPPAGGARVSGVGQAHHLVIDAQGTRYAVFAPEGATWQAGNDGAWVGTMPASKTYFSIAALPDDKPNTLTLFTQHAYAFIRDTRVSWQYDQANSKVETRFTATTQAMEGTQSTPILGLYPHHWHQNLSVADRLGPSFSTVRGSIKTLASSSFTTSYRYLGWVPYWPKVAQPATGPNLNEVMAIDVRNARRLMQSMGNTPYYQGKGVHRVLKLMDVAEQQGDLEARDRLLALAKERMQEWFSGSDRKTYFQYDEKIGSFLSHPEEFFAIEQMNDRHFHYGYWIRNAAEIALRDPDWAAKNKWGGIVDKLVTEIAHTQRGDRVAPFLRSFDPYEGHSWANGVGWGDFGNNQESSSESVSAWAALMLWGEIHGDKALRDLGAYMLTTEAQAIDYYWFDVHGLVFPPEYKNVEAAILFGGKYEHNTWWTDEPRQIKGINLLPVTTLSTYLVRDPKYAQKNLDALGPEMAIYEQFGKRPSNPPPRDIWQDIFAKYQALVDPQKGLAMWDRWGAVEAGDTRTHTLHYMLSLQAKGVPDFSVSANTPFYAVFKRADGAQTHTAFNASNTPIEVKFSDGKTLRVMPRSLGVLK